MTDGPELHLDGPEQGPVLAFAHGAGVGYDSPFMSAFAQGLAARGVRVARFEFPYMAAQRADGRRRPPPKAEALIGTFRQVMDALGGPARVALGGKSMGGRIATLLAAEQERAAAPVPAAVALGYPFHPPGKPERLRTGHLAALRTPCLICQGERDPFGTQEEVAGYPLSPAVRLHWAADGDHHLAPRKASGRAAEQTWAAAIAAVAAFLGAG